MEIKFNHDNTCVPYRKKELYFLLTAPILLVFLLVFIYLWSFNFLFSFIFLGFYLLTCFFQAYCCAYQECPYIGGFCPAVIGIMPASYLAKWLYSGRKMIRTPQRFNTFATLGVICWIGLGAFPLYWLSKLGIGLAAAYLALLVIYALVFGLTICPACAIRDSCPGGQFYPFVKKLFGSFRQNK